MAKRKAENWRIKDQTQLTYLLSIAAKLQHGYELTRQEAVSAGNLLQMISLKDDVRLLFFEKIRSAPLSADHLWIALHYRLLKLLEPKAATAARIVSTAWGLADDKSVTRIEREKRSECNDILGAANESGCKYLLRQIESEREKKLTGQPSPKGAKSRRLNAPR